MKKYANLLFTLCFLFILIAIPILTWNQLDETESFYENRKLKEFPIWNLESFLAGDYLSVLESSLSDHAAYRTDALTLHTRFELDVLHLPVVNDVVVTKDLLLSFHKFGSWDTACLKEQAAETVKDLSAFQKHIQANGGQFFYVGLPEQLSYYRHEYPDFLENRAWLFDQLHSTFAKTLKEAGIPYIDMPVVYASLGYPKDFYSATDHHYRFPGAFCAYETTMQTINQVMGLNLPILSLSDLDCKELPNPYLGSRNRKLYGIYPNNERAIYAIPNVPFTRMDNGIPVPSTLYRFPKTDTEFVTYNLYMGGDIAETILKTNRPELPNALIVGDSFTNLMEPLFYTSFNETHILDLRHRAQPSIYDYISEYKPSIVIYIRDDTAFFSKEGNGHLY